MVISKRCTKKKTFNNIQHPFLIFLKRKKTLNKIQIECNFYNLIKHTYQKVSVNVILDEILASFSIKSAKKTRVPAIGSTTQKCTGYVASYNYKFIIIFK